MHKRDGIYRIYLQLKVSFGDSGGIQTHDLQNRNLTLYSAKLPSLKEELS